MLINLPHENFFFVFLKLQSLWCNVTPEAVMRDGVWGKNKKI